ncbi:MAG TPA: glycerol-3-phosphate dehydrogenase C-terminal domain-containing protein, partial [Lautropia sp.]|nr:glycerol-3-phosphate dehydrogenase C-terminal domain-containing protein [Lautropia sp.]
TYRKLAEQAVDMLRPVLSPQVARMAGPWTVDAPLPGGDFETLLGPIPAGELGFDRLCSLIRERHPWLPERLARRYAASYGTRYALVVGEAKSLQDLGQEVAPDIFAAELVYLREQEWARTAKDVLWRRSKLGLHLDEFQQQAVADWLEDPAAATPAPASVAAR